jgi:ABC-type cobalamin/Fe3+-siderophores transport systems, ATPase components
MNEPLLKLQGITYTYPTGNAPVMQGLDLEVQAGTCTAILGPNGAGKTTLLHLVLGWLRPAAGHIWLDGKELKSYSRRELGRWIGLVPQNENTPFDYSLLEYVLLGRTPYMEPLAMPGEADLQIAEQKLNDVGLSGLIHRTMPSLSGGERQLVLVARALTQQPKLLLLDEPTSHLDLSNKSRLIQVLRRLQAQGVTILFTTHEPDVASALATHMVLMHQGEVLQTGPAEEMMTDQHLSALYNIPIHVQTQDGKRIVIWDN